MRTAPAGAPDQRARVAAANAQVGETLRVRACQQLRRRDEGLAADKADIGILARRRRVLEAEETLSSQPRVDEREQRLARRRTPPIHPCNSGSSYATRSAVWARSVFP